MKFSDKIFDRMFKNRNAGKIARSLINEGYIQKDKRSKFITEVDKKRAKIVFKRIIQGEMNASKRNITMSEAFDKQLHSTTFTSRAEISRENMYTALKKFNYNLRSKSDLKYNTDQEMYEITRGRYKGQFVEIVHIPGGYPSYKIILI